jgi:alginate O-acetyltransferase complex protein AlgI
VLWRRRLPALPAPLGWALLTIFLLVTWVFFRAPSLDAAGQILWAMAGQAAPGPVMGGRTILAAAAVALIGPSSQGFVAQLRPRAWLAPVAALATLVALLKLGDGPAYEFIYFRF